MQNTHRSSNERDKDVLRGIVPLTSKARGLCSGTEAGVKVALRARRALEEDGHSSRVAILPAVPRSWSRPLPQQRFAEDENGTAQARRRTSLHHRSHHTHTTAFSGCTDPSSTRQSPLTSNPSSSFPS